jgi:hypothetical protein
MRNGQRKFAPRKNSLNWWAQGRTEGGGGWAGPPPPLFFSGSAPGAGSHTTLMVTPHLHWGFELSTLCQGLTTTPQGTPGPTHTHTSCCVCVYRDHTLLHARAASEASWFNISLARATPVENRGLVTSPRAISSTSRILTVVMKNQSYVTHSVELIVC